MYTLYKVKYNDMARILFGIEDECPELDQVRYVYERSSRFFVIEGSIKVPYLIRRKDNYLGEAVFSVVNNGSMEIHYRYQKTDWDQKIWSCSQEFFEKVINGGLHIPYLKDGTRLPDDVFDVFKLIQPDAKRGYFDYVNDKWILQ